MREGNDTSVSERCIILHVSELERPLTYSQRKQLALREEIVDAAFAEFAERGYHDTGIADVARRLGIGHGTFYRYFENKRDILDHVVTQLIDRLLDALAAKNAPDAATTLDDYRSQVGRIAAAVTKIFEDDPRAARMLLFEATSIDSELTDRVLSVYDTAISLTAAYFENGVRRGYLRPDLDVEASAEAIVGMVIAAIINILRHPGDTARHRRFSAALLALMLGGIVLPEARESAEPPGETGASA